MSKQESPSSSSRSSRRDFVRASLAAVGGAGLAACASASARGQGETSGSPLAKGATILFQGDSITDAGRSRKEADVASRQPGLGNGYAWLASANLLTRRDETNYRIYNRGISGNKVFQLADRWDADCLELRPGLVSILIGVNDIWHKRNGKYDGTIEIYERDYHALVARTREALPHVTMVLCEPFVLRCGAVDDSWFPEFDGYRAAAQRVAAAHDALWVPFHAMFEEATKYAPPEHWAKDGVHPSAAGASLMAHEWLGVVHGG